jgi:hypothetical protein
MIRILDHIAESLDTPVLAASRLFFQDTWESLLFLNQESEKRGVSKEIS